MNKKKILIIVTVFFVIGLCAGGYLLLHNYNNQNYMDKYTNAEYTKSASGHAMARAEGENIVFSIYKVDLFATRGNMAITDTTTGEVLIIWENIYTGENNFGIALRSEEDTKLCLDFDENGVGEYEDERELLCKYAEKVNYFMELANEEWGFDLKVNTAPYSECKK